MVQNAYHIPGAGVGVVAGVAPGAREGVITEMYK